MVWQSEVGIYSGSTSLPFRLWILCVHKPKQMKGEEKKKKTFFVMHESITNWVHEKGNMLTLMILETFSDVSPAF